MNFPVLWFISAWSQNHMASRYFNAMQQELFYNDFCCYLHRH